ncbi:CIC11C00000003242 [Sungouiella intermedia]|uniref:CIC11C00000003242 n=1 Tax=Sungouiella intermedia TaxID=45354 RepID=A0A1L0B904_9ASCO|nr:CIC11C00000003242 [[Candida] intermedia]
MIEPDHVTGRMVALFASVFVSLVAGTPYLYGVYAPQLVQRVGLSTSDAATISLAVNIGAGLGGLPAGLFIDKFGPQRAIWLGSACIFSGYFSLNRIYSFQIGSLLLVCVAMAFVGFGSVTSFFAGLKAAQANFPHHRGTAGALPVGAYGLAATLFSLIAAKFFNGESGKLLAFLAYFCGSVAFLGSWFIHIYDPVPINLEEAILLSDLEDSGHAPRMKRSFSLRGSFSFWGIGSRSLSMSLLTKDQTPFIATPSDQRMKNLTSMSSMNLQFAASQDGGSRLAESSPVLTSPSTSTLQEVSDPKPESAWNTIKSLVSNRTYLAHYCIVSLCSGMGQMYIYTVGFIVTAQFNYHNTADGSPASLQAVQVSTISIAQFCGRVIAGVLSDYLYKRLNAQRQWVVLGTIFLICTGQLLLILTNSIHTITIISLLLGCGYGLLNGTYPAIIADSFGVKSFTTAWGLICSGPLVILFTLDKYFGIIYDSQSNESGQCFNGNDCYKGAFQLGVLLSAFTLVGTLALMYTKRRSTKPQL